jgi:hypothetical protein
LTQSEADDALVADDEPSDIRQALGRPDGLLDDAADAILVPTAAADADATLFAEGDLHGITFDAGFGREDDDAVTAVTEEVLPERVILERALRRRGKGEEELRRVRGRVVECGCDGVDVEGVRGRGEEGGGRPWNDIRLMPLTSVRHRAEGEVSMLRGSSDLLLAARPTGWCCLPVDLDCRVRVREEKEEADDDEGGQAAKDEPERRPRTCQTAQRQRHRPLAVLVVVGRPRCTSYEGFDFQFGTLTPDRWNILESRLALLSMLSTKPSQFVLYAAQTHS